MADQRVSRLAEILVGYCVNARKGETIEISFGYEGRSLALEVFKLILKRGAYPLARPYVHGFDYAYYSNAADEQIRHFPKIAMYETKNTDACISIGAETNTKELASISPTKIMMRKKTTRPIFEQMMKKRWVICEFPTSSLAQQSEMSLEEFEDFVYESCIQDWKKESKKQDRLKKILDNGKTVRIVGKGTDIAFSIKGRKAIKGDGKENMPDGEVYISPVENSAEGRISFTYPLYTMGKAVEGIKLDFSKGTVVDFSAKKNEEVLAKALEADNGAKRLGEFGIGTNYKINRFVREILFDEKIGGTVHLALGMGFDKSGGKNRSAIHYDIIKDLRNGGKLFVDGRLIQKNGKFVF